MRPQAIILAAIVTACATAPPAKLPVEKPDAGVELLSAGAVCSGRDLPKNSAPNGGCAPGLVCCYHPSGAYNPHATAHCMPPCDPGQPFCTLGCYNPPVP